MVPDVLLRSHATPPSLASLNITPRREGPTYSKEYLQELKASTPSSLPRPKPDQDQDVSMTDLDTSYDVEGALIIDSADTGGSWCLPINPLYLTLLE